MNNKIKNKMKNIFKKFIVIIAIVFVLLPNIGVGFVNAIEAGYLNSERAGNYAANFAINFYDNWSSINLVESGGSNQTAKINGSYKFSWPVTDMTQSSAYGLRYWGNSSEFHQGIDVPVALGTPIFSSSEGVVVDSNNGCTHNYSKNGSCGCGGGYGNNVKIETNQGYAIIYGHLTEANVKTGDKVSQGQQIGTSGTTGWSTGPHLHFEMLTNDISGVPEGKYHEKSLLGYSYTVDPAVIIEGDATISSGTSGVKKEKVGEVKTEYNSEKGPTEIPEEKDTKYELSNKSWITTVYKYSLNLDVDSIFSGSGNSAEINSAIFNKKTEIDSIKEEASTSEYLDATQLISEGKILPGDILYADKGDGTGDYLLFVGGTKVLYATEDPLAFANGALKYEYLENYLKRVKNNLENEAIQNAGEDANIDVTKLILPKYGVTKVFRLKSDVANNISEKDANLFFNGKGYYSKVTYEGIPETTLYETGVHPFRWLFSFIGKLFEFIINLIVYMIRMQIVAIVTLYENLLTNVILGISGDNHSPAVEAFFGTNATSASGERLTIESLFFNRIPIFDANFYNFKTAGGMDLSKSDNDLVYILRRNLNMFYVIIRNFSIALMLFILIGVGIKIAITSVAEKKAKYQQFLLSWLYAFCVIVLMHIFMYMVFIFSDYFVDLVKDLGNNIGANIAQEELSNVGSKEEISLYDAVRVKAYAFNWKEGVPATVVYIYMVYLLFRFSFIYYKRYLAVYILAITSTFICAKYALDRLRGNKTKSINKWFKDFAFNVFLQPIHALIYLVFISIAVSVSSESIGGAVIACVILNFMLKADQIIIKIFGLDKSGILNEVNRYENWNQLVHKFMPAVTISKNVYGAFVEDNGFFRRLAYWTTNADNRKDADKILDMRKYRFAGWRSRVFSGPIRGLGSWMSGSKVDWVKNLGGQWSKYQGRYGMLGKDLSYKTNKKIYEDIKGYRRERRQRFTRPIGQAINMGLGIFGTVASIGFAIADPSAGLTMYLGSKRKIDKYKSFSKTQMKMNRYAGTKQQAKEALGKATLFHEAKGKTKEYNDSLEKYTHNQFLYEQEYNSRLNAISRARAAGDTAHADELMEQTREFMRKRKREAAIELNELSDAYEALTKAKIEYGNAKHEHNSNNMFGKGFQKIVKGTETLTGLSGIQNLANSDANAAFKEKEKVEKHKKKLSDLEKTVELEKDYRKLVNDLNDELKRQMPDASDDEVNKILNQTIKLTSDIAQSTDINAKRISKQVIHYLSRNNKEKVVESDLEQILEEVNNDIVAQNRDIMKANLQRIDKQPLLERIKIDENTLKVFKKAFEEKKLKDSKGKGLEAKDVTVLIRQVIGKENMMPTPAPNINNSNIDDLLSKILRKNTEIRTYNQIGKIKHGSELIDLQKMIKDSKKDLKGK